MKTQMRGESQIKGWSKWLRLLLSVVIADGM
jgi:hypothetical protein